MPIAIQIALGCEDHQSIATCASYFGDIGRFEFPGARPDHKWLIEHRKGSIGSVCGDKIIEIFGDPIDWDWVAIKIEPLIDDRELEILCIGDLDQLRETPIERIGALPADDKAIDTSFLGLPNMLLHHLLVIARKASQQR